MGVVEKGSEPTVYRSDTRLLPFAEAMALHGLVNRIRFPWDVLKHNSSSAVDALINASTGNVGQPLVASCRVPDNPLTIKPFALGRSLDVVADLIGIKFFWHDGAIRDSDFSRH
jgi:hypothetical protein